MADPYGDGDVVLVILLFPVTTQASPTEEEVAKRFQTGDPGVPEF